MFGAKDKSLPRMIIGAKRPGFSELVADFVGAAGSVAHKALPTAGTTQSRDGIALTGGGSVQIGTVNLDSAVIKQLFAARGLTEGYIISFAGVPKRSAIDELDVRGYYAKVADACNSVLNTAFNEGRAPGVVPEDLPFVFSVI
jgi:hypothetical protein